MKNQETKPETTAPLALAPCSAPSAEAKLWHAMQMKADLFDYLCWLEVVTPPDELHGTDFLCMASDGTTCWGKTYAEAVRVAMEHDKEIFDATQSVAEPRGGL